MIVHEVFEVLKEKFGDGLVDTKISAAGGSAAGGYTMQLWIQIAPEKAKEICLFLRDETIFQFNYLSCLSGIEYPDGTLGVVYHLTSTVHKHKLILKTRCTKENMHVHSVSSVWGTANWHEREAFDLFGIIFDGHPDLRRILLPDDWEGHPLRKNYQVQEFYHGIKVPY